MYMCVCVYLCIYIVIIIYIMKCTYIIISMIATQVLLSENM